VYMCVCVKKATSFRKSWKLLTKEGCSFHYKSLGKVILRSKVVGGVFFLAFLIFIFYVLSIFQK